jgi:hypothetical protein
VEKSLKVTSSTGKELQTTNKHRLPGQKPTSPQHSGDESNVDITFQKLSQPTKTIRELGK